MSSPTRSHRILNSVDSTADPTTPDAWLTVVAEKVKGLHFGIIQIVVHDSKVVQIERTERTRFEIPQSVPNR